MGIGLKLLTTISIISLAHSIYSAYESTLTPSLSSQHHIAPDIPLDIQIQTILSTFILLACIVFSSAPLRPIRWAEWAGRIEREGWDPNAQEDVPQALAKAGAGNPYLILESRKGFWDVRGAREGFAAWVRGGGSMK